MPEFKLTPQQNRILDRIKAFMESDASVFILCGYAGTGKTTMIKAIADWLSERCDLKLMAPTGRASRVLSEKTGYKVQTIHRSIYESACLVTKEVGDIAESEFTFVFPIRVSEFKNRTVAIVDEASMVCSRTIGKELFRFGTDNIMNDLLTYVRPDFGGKLIFVGDPAQLPPVGEPESNALCADFFVDCGIRVWKEELTEVLRQKSDSVILKNAMMIRDLLQKSKRNHLVFEEKKDEVETVHPDSILSKYLGCKDSPDSNDCALICFSNRKAALYNKDIRRLLYGADEPIRKGDVLLIAQNNYTLNRMNGEFVTVLGVGERLQQSAPVYVQQNGRRERVLITLTFVQVQLEDGDCSISNCLLIEDLLNNEDAMLSIDEHRALYINFCMRHPELKQGTEEFAQALRSDTYYNAVRAKYGYAVTGHKCQGGEWNTVFVDYANRTGLSNDCLRWAYTATTRAQNRLYVTNFPHITPFSKFRIDSVQKCKKVDAECRVIGSVPTTPFHGETDEMFLRAKYQCIADNMKGTPYRIVGVSSKPYLEIYKVESPAGISRFDLYYKDGGIFSPATSSDVNGHTELIKLILNDEREFPMVFDYHPSDEFHEKLYNFIHSACDGLSIQLTNVVEHPEDYSVIFYMKTSNVFSYIKIYIDNNGFVTYAKPMSMIGSEDNELQALINDLNHQLI